MKFQTFCGKMWIQSVTPHSTHSFMNWILETTLMDVWFMSVVQNHAWTASYDWLIPASSSAGIFGSTHLDPSLLPSPKPIADSNPGYHSNSTSDPYPSSSFTVETVTYSPQNRSDSTPAATTGVPPATSSQALPTQPYTTPPDWLASVTSLSTAWPSSTASAPNTGIRCEQERWKQQGVVGNVRSF